MVARETGRRDGVKSATRLRSSGELYRCRERAYDMAPCPNRSLSAAESNRQMPLSSSELERAERFIVIRLTKYIELSGDLRRSEGTDGAQDAVCKVDAADSALSAQLQAWSSWTSDALATGQQGVQQPQYAALANALAQAVASEVVPGSSLGAIAPDALDAAFAVDAAGANAVAPERLSHSLAALATACGADGSAAAAAAVLELLLAKLQPQAEQLLRQAAAVTASSSAPAGAGAGDGNDSDDELDKLLAEDAVAGGDEDDVSPVSDQTQVAAAPAPAPPQAPAAAAGDADDDGDDALSLGLSRSTSIASASAAPAGGAVATAVARVTLGSAVQHDSAKSLGGKSMGALSRALSAASSDGLDDLPDNLDAMETRGASHGAAGASKGPRTKPLLAGLMESEQGKGSMASMPTDLRDWSNLKNRQPGAAMVASISEPGPLGPQAEWKQLPALGHGVRLHPHELRQPSSGNLRGSVAAPGGSVSKSVAISLPGLTDDKLPALPALMEGEPGPQTA
eukprot:XP_001696181.1 predicted protein [Chlamydomonas reinhardtii]